MLGASQKPHPPPPTIWLVIVFTFGRVYHPCCLGGLDAHRKGFVNAVVDVEFAELSQVFASWLSYFSEF